MKHTLLVLIIFLSFRTYSQVEARLPFSNIEYNSMSLRPLTLLDADFAVRFYINNGGSVDRIITLIVDSINSVPDKPESVGKVLLRGSIQFIGKLYYPDNDSSIFYFDQHDIDRSRMQSAIATILLLDLWHVSTRKEVFVKMHQPNSLYTIEIKAKQDYHTFYFYTLYPSEPAEDSVYGKIQNSIFSIFPEIKNQIIKN